jgi:uncharacterized protein YcgL (UPF0745 family)
MYLYVHSDTKLEDLPEELLKLVKALTHVMDLELSEQRKLARVNVTEVMKALEENGYFIQMPPEGLNPTLHYGD